MVGEIKTLDIYFYHLDEVIALKDINTLESMYCNDAS